MRAIDNAVSKKNLYQVTVEKAQFADLEKEVVRALIKDEPRTSS